MELFENYLDGAGSAYDEMFDGDDLRGPYEALAASFRAGDGRRGDGPRGGPDHALPRAGRHLRHRRSGAGVPARHLPRVIEQDAWSVIDAGVQQRVAVLEMFLEDVFDTGRASDDGVVPRSVVTTSSHYHRVAAGVKSPNGVRIHVAGIDLVRDDQGAFRVLEDNVRGPSGVSYVMTNRRAISAVLSEAFTSHRIRPVGAYPRRLLNALRASAPVGVDDPTVVVLTPGVGTTPTCPR